jgi:hypothetical protein
VKDGHTDLNESAFDENRDWLIRTDLRLFEIVSLAHGISPTKTVFSKFPAHYSSLKTAIIRKRLKAHYDGPELNLGAVVVLSDLIKFLTTAGSEYEWLRDFAERWQAYHAIADSKLGTKDPVEHGPEISPLPAHRPPEQRNKALEVLRTFSPEQLSEKLSDVTEAVNQKLDYPVSKKTVDAARKLLIEERQKSA